MESVTPPIDALAFELLRADFGAEMDCDASAAAMLIERASAHRASQAQHDRSAVVAGRGEELALETIEAHRAFAPCFARALGGKRRESRGPARASGFHSSAVRARRSNRPRSASRIRVAEPGNDAG